MKNNVNSSRQRSSKRSVKPKRSTKVAVFKGPRERGTTWPPDLRQLEQNINKFCSGRDVVDVTSTTVEELGADNVIVTVAYK